MGKASLPIVPFHLAIFVYQRAKKVKSLGVAEKDPFHGRATFEYLVLVCGAFHSDSDHQKGFHF